MAYMTKKELLEKVQPLSERLWEIQRELAELTEGSGDDELMDLVDRLARALDELEGVLEEAED
jgi:regulator of replication initiation timing